MRFKPDIRSFLVSILFACSTVASAQVTSISGKVTLKEADGTTVPARGAHVDIYRTDIKQEFHVKTDMKGSYQHAGIPFVGTYTVIVSAPGATPAWQEKVRFNAANNLDFMLQPGDGTRPSFDDIKKMADAGPAPAASVATSTESKESEAREELARKTKEIEEYNRKISESNEIVSRTFKAGNEALAANRLDEAISHYREGLAARPDEPALLSNLSEALRRRGVETYNAAQKTTPRNEAGINAAGKDWTEAAASSAKALAAIKNASAMDPQTEQIYAQNKISALTTRALAMRLVAAKVDQRQAQAAWTAYQEYLAVETDPARKAKSKVDALQMLLDAGATDLAETNGRVVLDEDPTNIEVHRILGLTLFASGDKLKFQEAANFLEYYVDQALDTDPLKAPARDALQYLKEAEGVTPKEPEPTTRTPVRVPRRRRP